MNLLLEMLGLGGPEKPHISDPYKMDRAVLPPGDPRLKDIPKPFEYPPLKKEPNWLEKVLTWVTTKRHAQEPKSPMEPSPALGEWLRDPNRVRSPNVVQGMDMASARNWPTWTDTPMHPDTEGFGSDLQRRGSLVATQKHSMDQQLEYRDRLMNSILSNILTRQKGMTIEDLFRMKQMMQDKKSIYPLENGPIRM